jgi:N-hydroxyarylamine O-acetyltransferase
MTANEIQAYLHRIGLEKSPGVSKEDLFRLQRHHLYAIPFENLDIHRGIWIEPKDSFEKVILNRRGGFCYELNSLFYQLLKSLGFEAFLISGSVADDAGKFGPEYDHLTILVEFEDEFYLVDVGFGEFSLEPLKIVLDEHLFDPRGTFQIRQFTDDRLIVEKIVGRRVIPKYHFSVHARDLSEFMEMCRFHQTDPTSPFKKKRLCSLPTPDGRITLTENCLRISSHDRIIQRTLASEDEVDQVLKEYFNM